MNFTFKALLQDLLDHVAELRFLGDQLHLGELDVVADLDHVIHEQFATFRNRAIHQVFTVVVDTVEDEEAGRSIFET